MISIISYFLLRVLESLPKDRSLGKEHRIRKKFIDENANLYKSNVKKRIKKERNKESATNRRVDRIFPSGVRGSRVKSTMQLVGVG